MCNDYINFLICHLLIVDEKEQTRGCTSILGFKPPHFHKLLKNKWRTTLSVWKSAAFTTPQEVVNLVNFVGLHI